MDTVGALNDLSAEIAAMRRDLEALKDEQENVRGTLTDLWDRLQPYLEQIQPTIDAVMASPIVKMLGVKVKGK